MNAQTQDFVSHKICSVQKKRADIESIRDHLKISSIDEVLSNLIDHNLVSNKITSAGFDSFRVQTEEPVGDQIYFKISDTGKNSSEQLTYDPQDIPDSSQIDAVPQIETSVLDIYTEFVTENLCGAKSKENNLIPP